jgi:hypothetical protein
MEYFIEPRLRVGGLSTRQVHAAVAHVAQHVLDHAAAVLGGERVERAAEGVREVRLVSISTMLAAARPAMVSSSESNSRLTSP